MEHLSEERRALCEVIRAAFAGVRLDGGIGLWEAQAIDDYETVETQATEREKDEKEDWDQISDADLNRCYSSLSFFDANGMRFHLPAFLLAHLEGRGTFDPIFSLTHDTEYARAMFTSLSDAQRHAVRLYLVHIADDPDEAFWRDEVLRSLDSFWTA